ncbi:MAG TPA: hypothetical protein VFA84_05415 [Acidimicrobiales bacterium]|nr:hypothetical protein [Acidimicrobiales bacterium]
MSGTRWPFRWSTGVRPLRADLHAMIDVTAQEALELGVVNEQWAALRDGASVTFTRAQLESFYPRGDEHPSLPPDLGVAEEWRLEGDDELVPVS